MTGGRSKAGGRYHLVADVRLDNRGDLAETLGINDAEARTLPDAGFVMRAWERWREACFAHLYGDYAIALWDTAERKLFLARDAVGGRPLHYHRGDGFFAFATMPKGLHALPEVPLAPDAIRTAELLVLMPEWGPRSFFEGVSRVEPGQIVIVDAKEQRAHRHWHPPTTGNDRWQLGDAAEAMRAELDRAVAARLRGGDGRIGAHLSAGLDSSAVAATAARLLAPTNGQVVAFTSVPREGYAGEAPDARIGDEGPLAAKTAALYSNIQHLLIRPDGGSTFDNWDRDFLLHDRPLVNPCNQRWINAINAEAQRRGLKVMLTGAMGNATLSYAGTELLPELAARFRWIALSREIAALAASGSMRWRGGLALAFGPWIPRPLWRALNRHYRGASLDLHAYSAVRPEYVREAQLSQLAEARELDFSYRPRKSARAARLWMLNRIDQANAAKAALAGYGIDLRDPTADRRLIEFCISLPTSLFLRGGQARVLGRHALADRLPPEVLEERRKGYQAVDWHEGLDAGREALRTEISRLEHVPAASQILDLAEMRATLENWPSCEWNVPQVTNKYRLSLLRGGAIGHFLRKASRSNA
ncbi:asparagine synthase-related protein [Sphingomonas sp. 7/4-4]|uniref:asparagine synthetase B family protein n=1 Tax=Sphingomonas sp. 7/4-4 TaxID=3018446 RepID=UPI0022F3A397|nr:asparagine synthetase B [Sphingomonas sp. 7/4-4]WBY07995.1 asparagine synthase-related protein [Sphingomonas sp. 7/4-4]